MELNNSAIDIKKFIIDNNIVGSVAGVCIALAAKDGIQSLVSDIIVPSVLILLTHLHVESFKQFLPSNGHKHLNITNFIKQLITFILVVVISFLFVKIAFGYLFGIPDKSDNKIDKKPNT